jgi:hypothetical protein
MDQGEGKHMQLTTKLAMATAFVALAACSSHNNANNSVDMNAGTDLNAGTTDMNATDMNAGMTGMNATGNADMNATGGEAGTGMNSGNATGAATNNGM